MKTLLLRAAPYLLGAAILLSMWAMWNTIGAQKERITAQTTAIDQLPGIVGKVIELNRGHAEGMEQLLSAQNQVQRTLTARQYEIRRLQNDVTEIRAWADQPLPDDIVRMRERPAIRGAADYGKSMPAGGTVSSASGGPQDERRNESGIGTD